MAHSDTSPITTTTTTAEATRRLSTHPDDSADFGDFESQGESLLSLVKPELDNLSRHWLAALKDHALLLLPAEFASQLPHDGGAFYTNDTMNSSKPHYLSSWPPILYAATLWLNDGGFVTDEDQSDVDSQNGNVSTTKPTATDNTSPSAISHGSPSADRFHLIFGVCMEALCSTRSSEKHESIVSCLQALHTVFDTTWSRRLLFKNRLLAVELCNVLHRLILTRDSLEVQLLCIEVLKRTIIGANEVLAADRNRQLDGVTDNEEKTEMLRAADLLGEGGEAGEILPGTSLAYAVLEVCLCLFVRQIPTMNPGSSAKLTCDQLQQQLRRERNAANNCNFSNQLGEDNGMLVASAMSSLESLTQLCSPLGAVQILPTILYLTNGVIKELATKSVNDTTIVANTAAVQAALHCLKAMATDRYSADDRCSGQWQRLLQSALAGLLDLTKTGSDDDNNTKMDEVTMMFAIAVFIRHSPSNFVSTPSLKFPCINHFRQCLQQPANDAIKLKCIQTMRSIFVNAELVVATPYIHALAPRVMEALCSDAARAPKTDAELAVTLESVSVVETLVALAEPQNRKWNHFRIILNPNSHS